MTSIQAPRPPGAREMQVPAERLRRGDIIPGFDHAVIDHAAVRDDTVAVRFVSQIGEHGTAYSVGRLVTILRDDPSVPDMTRFPPVSGTPDGHTERLLADAKALLGELVDLYRLHHDDPEYVAVNRVIGAAETTLYNHGTAALTMLVVAGVRAVAGEPAGGRPKRDTSTRMRFQLKHSDQYNVYSARDPHDWLTGDVLRRYDGKTIVRVPGWRFGHTVMDRHIYPPVGAS